MEYVDSLFKDVIQTDKVLEQKEELQSHLTDRIKGYMADSMNFDQAFEAAKGDLGEADELIKGFDSWHTPSENAHIKRKDVDDDDDWDDWDCEDDDEDDGTGLLSRLGLRNNWKLVALSPFIFIFLGFMFGWWAWAWVIIPVIAIVTMSGLKKGLMFVSLTPFIFVLLGFAFGWWAWAWAIIPISAILLHDK